jgi:formate dehydrogenase iron-sulfur subunit
MGKGVLVDLTKCIGCRGCQIACKEWNERSVKKTTMLGTYTNPPALNSECYTHIRFYEHEQDGPPVWSFVKYQCLHCEHPACAAACPVKALAKTRNGPVTYDYDRCIGCRYCMVACPFHVPKYEWESTRPWVQKCTFCSERIKDDMVPACIKTCPTGTMAYGERKEMLAEGQRRIADAPGKYVQHIYGEKEAGGTSWMYISAVPLEKTGFNMHIASMPLPDLTWAYIAKIPAVAGIVIAGGALSWVITRRNNQGKGE